MNKTAKIHKTIIKPSEPRRYLTMNTNDGSVSIVLSKSYWKALKSAQRYFGEKARVRVWEDKLSTC